MKVIGIGGPPKSGKSSLAVALACRFDCPIIQMDRHIRLPINYPDLQYDMNGIVNELQQVIDSQMIIMEGLLCFVAKEIMDCLDFKILWPGKVEYKSLFYDVDIFSLRLDFDIPVDQQVEQVEILVKNSESKRVGVELAEREIAINSLTHTQRKLPSKLDQAKVQLDRVEAKIFKEQQKLQAAMKWIKKQGIEIQEPFPELEQRKGVLIELPADGEWEIDLEALPASYTVVPKFIELDAITMNRVQRSHTTVTIPN